MSAAARPTVRVLIVDDEAQIRALVRVLVNRLSSKYALQLVEASSAEEAMSLVDRETFHLVVSDHNMKGRTGIDLLAHVFQHAPRTARMLITALTQVDIGVDAVNRGHVDAFLRKPWDSASFVALVESLISARVGALPLPPPAAGAARAAPTSASERAALAAQVQQLDLQIRQVRVRLGLGKISAEAYTALTRELQAKRGAIEARLLNL